MTRYWLWSIRPHNFDICRSRNFDVVGFRAGTALIRQINPEDKIVVAVTRLKGIGALLDVASSVFHDTSRVWTDPHEPAELFPYRLKTRPTWTASGSDLVDLQAIWRSLDTLTPAQKGDPRGLGALLQRTLREIPQKDYATIESATIRPAPPVPPPTASVPAVPRRVPSTKKRVFGRPLNFRELRHEPINEQGVVYLFGMVARELGFLVEGVAAEFPDCAAKRMTRGGLYEPVKIEFEFRASNFQQHGHDPSECDLIVCWENDWPACPIDVLELEEEIKRLQP